jgi:hypothetical protein
VDEWIKTVKRPYIETKEPMVEAFYCVEEANCQRLYDLISVTFSKEQNCNGCLELEVRESVTTKQSMQEFGVL